MDRKKPSYQSVILVRPQEEHNLVNSANMYHIIPQTSLHYAVSIYMQAYAEVMMIEDTFAVPRLEHLLTRSVETSPDLLGILHMVQLRNLRQPWRRCAAYRLVHSICKIRPDLVPPCCLSDAVTS